MKGFGPLHIILIFQDLMGTETWQIPKLGVPLFDLARDLLWLS